MTKLTIKLSGPMGNAFVIMGAVRDLLPDQKTRDEYVTKATAGTYQELLNVSEEFTKAAGHKVVFR